MLQEKERDTEKKFLSKLLVCCSGGPFMDGYVLTIIGIALIQLTPYLQMNSFWTGMVGAASLLGMFAGGLLFGYLTDVMGRRVMFRLTPIAVVILSVGQMLVVAPWQLLILRFFIGMIVGGDYPIATSILTEFSPAKKRGIMLGVLNIMWYVGATVASLVGYAFYDFSNGWQIMLGSAAIPALLLVFGRWNTPESPMWLASKNRLDEAQAILKGIFGSEAQLEQTADVVRETHLSNVFKGKNFKKIIFCILFWTCQILPMYAIYTFGPRILEALKFGSGKSTILGDIIISAAFLTGNIIAAFLVDRIGRRSLIIWSYVLMSIGMTVVVIFADATILFIGLGFVIYALASGGPNVLDWIYPNELFPTEIRASAVGIATAFSRIGACLGVFAVPIWMDSIGTTSVMIIMTAITIFGTLMCVALAPETKGLSLSQIKDADVNSSSIN